MFGEWWPKLGKKDQDSGGGAKKPSTPDLDDFDPTLQGYEVRPIRDGERNIEVNERRPFRALLERLNIRVGTIIRITGKAWMPDGLPLHEIPPPGFVVGRVTKIFIQAEDDNDFNKRYWSPELYCQVEGVGEVKVGAHFVLNGTSKIAIEKK